MAFEQPLAHINNYICTHQYSKAKTALNMLKRLCPGHEAYKFFDQNKSCDLFGKNWENQDLNNKSLEVFCDHGMGDTVMMLRYIKKLKEKYDVKIVLNSLKYDPLKRLFDSLDFVDIFTNKHILCDYHVNIMELPKLYHDKYTWEDLLKADIPEQPILNPLFDAEIDLSKYRFGIKYESNPLNILFDKKSIPDEIKFENTYSLEPVDGKDIADVMAVMAKLPLIVSVDTLTLHLAGSMRLPTIGVLAYDSDLRWGDKEKTPWYPTVSLLRQDSPGDWAGVFKKLEKIFV